MILLNCKKCNKEFKVRNYLKHTAHFCSKYCAYTDPDRRKKQSERIKANPIPSKSIFVKGHRQSAEARKKMSLAKLGKTPHNKKEDIFIMCRSCGIIKKIKYSQRHRAKFCSRVCADKGKDFGKTDEQKRIRTSVDYRLWRLSVFERDNFTCQLCGTRGGKLNADHIKRFSDFPELRLELSNGRTLCEDCHRKTETYGNRGKKNRCIAAC